MDGKVTKNKMNKQTKKKKVKRLKPLVYEPRRNRARAYDTSVVLSKSTSLDSISAGSWKKSSPLYTTGSPIGPGGTKPSRTFALTAGLLEDDADATSVLTYDDDSVISAEEGPGFAVSPFLTKKYFGQPAKFAFNAQCNWLYKQLSYVSTTKNMLPKIIFPNAEGLDDDDTTSIASLDRMDDQEFDEMTLPTTTECVANIMVQPDSPRSNYIYECLSNKVNPRAHLLVRDKKTTALLLRHQGMGDDMAIHLSKAVGSLPCLQTIDLSDNGLTDAGLNPMLTAILAIPTLTELNVSQNVIGPESAEALAAYVSHPDCPLVKLIMQRADVDDFEGEAFVTAMSNSKTLKYLDLSMNLLGQAENLNTVMPDLVTAPEALASLLRTPGCVLETLILSWNMIRLDSGIDLASSISCNSSLTHLDLSDNSLNAEGGKTLGEALIDNRSIKRLIVCNNGITASACFTICVGVQENLALQYLSVDGNPIGEAGAKALMLIPTSCGGRVTISAKNCNALVKDAECWFNFNQPCQEYELDLTDSFDRSVAFQLFRIMANHMTYIGKDICYQYPAEKGVRPVTETMEFIQIVTKEKMEYYTDAQKMLFDNLELLRQASMRMDKVTDLFHMADIDKSGELNRDELRYVLDQCGISLTDTKLDDAILQFDVDGEGTIELSEFLSFVKSLHDEAVVKIQDMCDTIHMAHTVFPTKRYIPPKEGILRLELLDGFAKKDLYQIITDSDRVNITQAAAATGDLSNLLPLGFEGMKIRADEAMELYETMFREIGDKISVLIKLLPQVSSPAEAKKLIKKVTNNDLQEIQRIKAAMGQSVKPILGNPCGFYYLDLANPVNRICLAQLFEHSQTLGKRLQSKSKVIDGWFFGDVSQHQNWSCFRNEVYNGNPVIVTPKDFTPIPKTGKLSFDFSTCGFRPEGIPTIISDQKLIKLLITGELIEPIEKLIYTTQLESMLPDRDMLRNANLGIGKTCHEFSTKQAIEIAEHCHQFSNNLITRVSNMMECARREELPDEFVDANALKRNNSAGAVKPSTSRSGRASAQSPNHRKTSTQGGALARQDSKLDIVLEAPSESFASDIFAVESQEENNKSKRSDDPLKNSVSTLLSNFSSSFLDSRQSSFCELFANNTEIDAIQAEEIEKASSREKFKKILHSDIVTDFAKAQSCLAMLVEVLAGYGLYCRHLALILKTFHLGKNKKTTFYGTYRTELVVDIFPNIVDIHNFELIWRELSPFEVACVSCRIGRLSLFNPMKPEGGAVLNLSVLEDRHVAKMILMLSAVEPGDNIKDAAFRLYYDVPNIPGWEINSLWMTEEGVQKKGFLTYNYYTGQGKNLDGCRADIRWRTAMFHSVLVNEADIIKCEKQKVSDEEIIARRKATTIFMDSTREKWTTYLRFKPEKDIQAFQLST